MNVNLIKKAEEESQQGKNLSYADLMEIAEKYAEEIWIPKVESKKQFVICPVGLVGAGKTTVIKPIAETLNLIRISTDEIRHLLQQEGFNYLRTIDIAKYLLLKFINENYNIAIDADSISPDIRQEFHAFAQAKNIEIIFVHINPPEDFIINKLENYNHSWLFKDADDAIANLNRRKPLHEKYLGEIDFYYEFDTSRDDLQKQINDFVKKFQGDFEI